MFIYNTVGGNRNVQVNGVHGIMMGTPMLFTVETRTGVFSRVYNTTTVRYGPNAPVVNNNPSWPGVGSNFGSNNPLNSAHTGGVHVLLADGAVRFIGDSIDMGTLRRLSARDDDGVVGEF